MNNTRVDSASLAIRKENKEWLEFVNMRNERKWKSSDMTDARWRQATDDFNARTSPHEVVPKKVSAVKKCLRDLEITIEKRHATSDYDSLSCFEFSNLVSTDLRILEEWDSAHSARVPSEWWKITCFAVPGFEPLVCTSS